MAQVAGSLPHLAHRHPVVYSFIVMLPIYSAHRMDSGGSLPIGLKHHLARAMH